MSSRNSNDNILKTDKSIIASPQVVFKMAKKIAQLTKVVYYLHTRTEDHDDELDYLSEKIQDHVRSINDLAKSQIKELTFKADEARILNKAHEDMIAANLDQINELEVEKDSLKTINDDLKIQLELSQK
jgi:hypothetical protein